MSIKKKMAIDYNKLNEAIRKRNEHRRAMNPQGEGEIQSERMTRNMRANKEGYRYVNENIEDPVDKEDTRNAYLEAVSQHSLRGGQEDFEEFTPEEIGEIKIGADAIGENNHEAINNIFPNYRPLQYGGEYNTRNAAKRNIAGRESMNRERDLKKKVLNNHKKIKSLINTYNRIISML